MLASLSLQPDQWDYSAAHVPSPLTDDQAAEQRAKQKVRDKRRRKARKQHGEDGGDGEDDEDDATAAVPASATPAGPSLLVPQGVRRPVPAAAAASAATDREKRAAAAEARLRTLGSGSTTATASGPSCSWCRKSLAGMVPFERNQLRYCSTDCVHAHRQQQEQRKL